MNQPNPENGAHKKAIERFEAMKKRLEANESQDFGGAMLIVAPDGTVEECMALDPNKDKIAFLVTAQGKVAGMVEMAKADDDARRGFGGGGLPRR